MLQKLFISSRKIFVFIITFFTTKICVVENKNKFSYIRVILKIFVLFSIIISNFAWMRNNHVVYIKKQIEIISKITFFFNRIPFFLNINSNENCFQLIAMRKKTSRNEHYHFNIIKKIIKLINIILLNLLFVIYDHEKQFYRFNIINFMKKIKSIEHHWIIIIYYFAIKYKVYDFSLIYIDESNH